MSNPSLLILPGDGIGPEVMAEVRKIIDECYEQASTILHDNRNILEIMKDALLEYETIDSEQIDDIMHGKKPRPPADWDDSDSDDSGASKVEAEQKPDSTEDDKSGTIGGPAGEH